MKLVPTNLYRRSIAQHLIFDTIVIIASLLVALFLRVGPEEFQYHLNTVWVYLPLIVVCRWICLIAFGCYNIIWRFVSTSDAVRLAKAISLSTAIILAFTFFVPEKYLRLPRSVYVIDAILVMLGLLGMRMLRRLQHEAKMTKTISHGRPTLIYGAGQNGRLLASRFRSDAALDTNLVGFIDDDSTKQNLVIHDVPVLGTRKDLARIIEEHKINQLIIALPNLPGELLREIVQITRLYNIRPRITTSLSQTAETSKRNVEIYRNIELSDLLNRPPKDMDLTAVREMIRNKRVLVTGAGGSIGSELCRQIMSHDPGRLILLDNSEFNLYEIDKELRMSTHDMQKVVPLMVDLKDERTLRTSMKEFAPEVVFHAAAYKHVHLVEANPYPSILNNIFGTKILLDICQEIGVQVFVMISTDKAVNPAGVMGATKRVCELLVTSAANETGRRFCSVRFGNVLGSSGSLIPLLKKQIEDGGPVTITHQDMTRFFMLIPEAVQLVLKAATIARQGDVNVLKMGAPVKILDIAKSLIALMGETEEQIPILFTGLRPGEKMFEELYIRGDELNTEHPDILTLPNGDWGKPLTSDDVDHIHDIVEKLVRGAHDGSKQALFDLNELVKSNYQPSPNEEKDSGVSKLSAMKTPQHNN